MTWFGSHFLSSLHLPRLFSFNLSYGHRFYNEPVCPPAPNLTSISFMWYSSENAEFWLSLAPLLHSLEFRSCELSAALDGLARFTRLRRLAVYGMRGAEMPEIRSEILSKLEHFEGPEGDAERLRSLKLNWSESAHLLNADEIYLPNLKKLSVCNQVDKSLAWYCATIIALKGCCPRLVTLSSCPLSSTIP